MAEKMAATVLQAVDWIGLHDEPYPDEALALLLALLEGKEQFPGVAKAWAAEHVRFFPAGREVNTNNLPCYRARILELGFGGKRYDEHGKENAGSSATLMAKDLGKLDDPTWRPLLNWVLANDQEGLGTAFDWADTMKVFFHAGWGNLRVLKRTIRVMRAVFRVGAGIHQRKNIADTPDFWELAAQFVLSLTDNPYKNNPVYLVTSPAQAAELADIKNSRYCETITWLLKYEADIKGLPGFSTHPKPPREPGFMELPKIVSALYHDGASVDEVRRLVFDILKARIAEQELFFAAVGEYAAIVRDSQDGQLNPKGYILKVTEEGMAYQVAVVISDNRRILSVIRARMPSPQVIVRVKSSGHISFFMKPLDSEPIIVRLREACWRAMGHRESLSPEELRAEWTTPRVPFICWQKRGSNGLNGSLTNEEVPPIPLELWEYLMCVVAGLRKVMRAVKDHRRAMRRGQRQRQRVRVREASVATSVSVPIPEPTR